MFVAHLFFSISLCVDLRKQSTCGRAEQQAASQIRAFIWLINAVGGGGILQGCEPPPPPGCVGVDSKSATGRKGSAGWVFSSLELEPVLQRTPADTPPPTPREEVRGKQSNRTWKQPGATGTAGAAPLSRLKQEEERAVADVCECVLLAHTNTHPSVRVSRDCWMGNLGALGALGKRPGLVVEQEVEEESPVSTSKDSSTFS